VARQNEPLESMRLDKWLWCARFYKTRTLAAAAIKGHKVNVNDQAIKAAKTIKPGDKVEIRKTPYQWAISVRKLINNRVSATQLASLFEEDEDSITTRENLSKQMKADAASFPKTIGRPTKRNRREIIRFTRIPKEE
jgi:ribosome-associated heat shock protein Hsp15